MQNEQLLQLLHKHAAGTCTPEELNQLETWYQSLQVAHSLSVTSNDEQLAQSLLADFKRRQVADGGPVVVHRVRFLRLARWVAAAAVLAFVLVAGFYYFSGKSRNENKAFVALSPRQSTQFVRQLRLPDGTVVILQKGSTLVYPAAFTGGTRSVTLSGEAFFDVAHNPAQPFRIVSGSVTTTVLGTAFNIKAWPGQNAVTVSVSRGKVKVENGGRVLGTLTKNQELVYNLSTNLTAQRSANDALVKQWTRQGITFNDVAFKTIAAELERRFQQPIRIDDSTIGSQLINASFDGTESLAEILEVLCLTTGTRYTQEGNGYIIRKTGTN